MSQLERTATITAQPAQTTREASADQSRDDRVADAPRWRHTWPSERFYWTIADTDSVPSLHRRIMQRPHVTLVDQPALDDLVADDFPCELDDLHVVYQPLLDGSGRVIACAARRDDLDTLPEHVLEVHADQVPSIIGESLSPSPSLPSPPNLLAGARTPRSIAHAHRTRSLVLAATVIMFAGVVSWGLHRRATNLAASTMQLQKATQQLIRQSVPDLPPAWPASIAELNNEHARLALTRTQPPSTPLDAGQELLALLNAWPAPGQVGPMPVQTQSISIAEDRMGVTISASSNDDARRFLAAFASPANWTFAEPQLTGGTGGTMLRLVASRTKLSPAIPTSTLTPMPGAPR
jgi:hypothetical protein